MDKEKLFSWHTLILPDLKEAIDEGRFDEVKEFLKDTRAQDIVDLLEDLDPPKRVIVFRLLDKEKATDVFSELSPDTAEELLDAFTREETISILKDLDPDDRVRLFDELPPEVVKKLIALLPKEERDEVLLLLNFPPGSAGHVMSPDFVEVKENMTTEEALKYIRKQAPNPEATLMAFVLDKKGRLKGTVNLTDLVLAPEGSYVKDLMKIDVPLVHANDDREDAARILQKYDLFAVPVVDSEMRLLGVITVDDVIDILEEETTEDMHLMAAMESPSPEEEYYELSLWEKVRKRIPWLVGLLLAETVASRIIKNFQTALSAVVALAFFIPMINGTAGNVGQQAVTLAVRAIALGEITKKHFFRIIIREILTGIGIGIILGVFSFLVSFWVVRDAHIAIAVSSALSIVVIAANFVGTLLPIFFQFIKVDPAVASNPLISTTMDITGMLVYFFVAKGFLG